MEQVILERRGSVGILTINRPQALNALNSALVAELSGILEEISRSDPAELRCLVVTGAGEKSFVAGADIGEMAEMSPDEAVQFSERGSRMMLALETLQIPVIAAVNGYALGGGFELALACDIRLLSDKAVFALPEASLGIPPGYGGLQRLARIAGPGAAKRIALTCTRIKAEEALSLGLAEGIFPAEELLDAAVAMAESIAANAPAAVRAVKRIINDSAGLTVQEAFLLEGKAFGECFSTGDQREAMQAFLEKRKPAPFTGR